jgi:hypothetical protein
MTEDAEATATFDPIPAGGGSARNPTNPTGGNEKTHGPQHHGSPQTRITHAVIKDAKREARFSFAGSGGTGPLRFLCGLDGRAMAPCSSPKTYRHLRPGRHTFQVEARDSRRHTDPQPAVRHFRIAR